MICGAKFPALRASPLSKGANGDVTSHVCRINLHMLGYVAGLSRSCTPNEAVTLRLHRPVKMFSTARLDGKLSSWRSTGSAHGLISRSPSLLDLHHGKTGKVAVIERGNIVCPARGRQRHTRRGNFHWAEAVDAMIRVSVKYSPGMPQTGCQGYRENNDGS